MSVHDSTYYKRELERLHGLLIDVLREYYLSDAPFCGLRMKDVIEAGGIRLPGYEPVDKPADQPAACSYCNGTLEEVRGGISCPCRCLVTPDKPADQPAALRDSEAVEIVRCPRCHTLPRPSLMGGCVCPNCGTTVLQPVPESAANEPADLATMQPDVCQHGIRSPWACDQCEEAAWKVRPTCDCVYPHPTQYVPDLCGVCHGVIAEKLADQPGAAICACGCGAPSPSCVRPAQDERPPPCPHGRGWEFCEKCVEGMAIRVVKVLP